MFSSVEYTKSAVSSSNDYSELDNYYEGSQFGPKLPSSVPSMSYPTILDQKLPWKKYEALTHNSDGNNYYNVETAYGSSCDPKYYVAKCPSNQFLRPFVTDQKDMAGPPTPCPVRTQQISEGYQGPSDMAQVLKNLKVVFFYDGSGRCPYSREAIQRYQKLLPNHSLENVFVSLKDIRQFNNQKLLTDLHGTATPFFYSQVTNRSVTGFVPTIEALVQGLQQNGSAGTRENYEPTQGTDIGSHVRNLQLTVYVLRGCGFCDKLKSDLMKSNLAHLVRFVDAQDPAHRAALTNVRGFPHIVSGANGKSVTGHPGSLDRLVQSLM